MDKYPRLKDEVETICLTQIRESEIKAKDQVRINFLLILIVNLLLLVHRFLMEVIMI